MKKIELGTGLLKIIDVGMYGSYLDPDEMYSSDLDELTQDLADKVNESFSYDLYKKTMVDVIKTMKVSIMEPLIAVGVGIKDIEFLEIFSPREYNFYNDTLDFNLIATNDFIKRLTKKINQTDQKKLDAYLYDNYSSYDGFISWTPNNITDLKKEVKREEPRAIAAFLNYFISRDHRNDMEMDLMEGIRGNYSLLDFLDSEEVIAEVQKEWERIDNSN